MLPSSYLCVCVWGSSSDVWGCETFTTCSIFHHRASQIQTTTLMMQRKKGEGGDKGMSGRMVVKYQTKLICLPAPYSKTPPTQAHKIPPRHPQPHPHTYTTNSKFLHVHPQTRCRTCSFKHCFCSFLQHQYLNIAINTSVPCKISSLW